MWEHCWTALNTIGRLRGSVSRPPVIWSRRTIRTVEQSVRGLQTPVMTRRLTAEEFRANSATERVAEQLIQGSLYRPVLSRVTAVPHPVPKGRADLPIWS
jgi:hypothetical protein